MKLSPLIKGIITGAAMICFSLFSFHNIPQGSRLHYLLYAIFTGGISWALIVYRNSGTFTGRFGDAFNTGFRCFVIAILMMTIYTFTFNKMHPEFAEQSATAYKAELIKNPGDRTPDQINEEVARHKKGYTMAVVYGPIFGYLIVGAMVTAVASALLTRRNT